MRASREDPGDQVHSLLHCHFESALRALAVARPSELERLRPVFELSRLRARHPGREAEPARPAGRPLAHDQDIFTRDVFAEVVRRLTAEMTSSGIRHVDLRVGVLMRRWPWIGSLADAIRAFKAAMPGPDALTVSFLGAVNLSKPHDVLDAVFGQVLEDASAAGLLAGLDINMRPADLAALDLYLGPLLDLQRSGLRVNVHLGELFGAGFSRQVLSRIIPSRIGHGVLLLDDAHDRRADPRARHLPGHVPGEQHPAGRLGLDPLQPRGEGDAPGAARHHQHRRPDPVQRRPGRQPGSVRPVPRPAGRGPAGRPPIRLPAVTPRMTLHVIYGIACAGKSTTALRLAADNGVRTIVSTDYLREVQRLYVPAAQSPCWRKSRTPPGNFPATRRRAASSPGSPATPRRSSPPSRPLPRSWPATAWTRSSKARHSTAPSSRRLRQHCQDAAVRPVLLTVDSLVATP